MHRVRRLLGPLCLLLALAPACGEHDEPARPGPDVLSPGPEAPVETPAGPPGAHWDMVEMLRESADSPDNPADLGGRAWLASQEPQRLTASGWASFRLVYEAGPLGIVEGGSLFLQVSPFWEWSSPQTRAPDAPGYTVVETDADDVRLEALQIDDQLLAIEIGGRELREGEQVRIHYGAGPAGATVDRFADAEARLWIAVDGDGDGMRRVLPDSPRVEVHAGPPAQLRVLLPGVVRPGETVPVRVSVLDREGSRGVAYAGEITLEGAAPVLELPDRVTLAPGAGGVALVEGLAREPGVARITARTAEGLEAESNPLLVSAEGPRILWGDLHGHSSLSDGTGSPEDYYRYARDVAGLDVSALTDHDHWGMRTLVANPELWKRIRAAAQSFHAPGRFVTLLGFEWTSWIHGHRHVLHFADDGPLVDSVAPATDSPLELWAALEGHTSLTFAHHSAGGPIPTNWEIPPDPHFEPVTEIVSVHGSSEALDSPGLIYDPVPGNFVRDVLDRGFVLGFIGSGDGHDGHPGLAHLASPTGGLAAILSEDRTREGVLEALRARRVYATNGPRILLRAALGAQRMGSTLKLAGRESVDETLFVRVISVAPLAALEFVRSGEIVDGIALEGRLEVSVQRPVEELRAGEYIYVRAVQEDGGAAWSSPVFIRE